MNCNPPADEGLYNYLILGDIRDVWVRIDNHHISVSKVMRAPPDRQIVLGIWYCRSRDIIAPTVGKSIIRRLMKGTIRYLEEELGLTVNQEKSRVAPIKDGNRLGNHRIAQTVQIFRF